MQAAEHLLPHIYPALQLALLAHLQRTIHTQVGLVALAALQAVSRQAQARLRQHRRNTRGSDIDAVSAPLPVPIAR